jgi:outer membrane protein OmpA-like peptidoglycan-associated protein
MKPLAPFGFAPKPHPLMRGLGALVLAICASAALALEGGFPPGAERTAQRIEALGSHALPIGPWADGAMLTQRVEGRVDQSAWLVPDAAEQGTLALLAPLRAALLAEGWQVLFECETLSCGGFDFRYSTQVLPEPAMHVDLGDFRFLSARRGRGEEREHLSLLVSRSAGAGTGHVQMIRVVPADRPVPEPRLTVPDQAPVAPPEPGSAPAVGMIAQALEGGSAVLDGVTFASGDAATVQGGDAALAALAAWLAANPDRTIALVGHTDASGSLEANVALSRKRAEAVRARLISDHGADGARITALGAGFMAPRGSNLTEEGRAKNRRVEVVVTSTR